MMGPHKRYLKALAFVPAIVLGGGFIGLQAGAFELFSKPQPQPDPQPAATRAPAPEDDPTFMPGSKFMRIGLRQSGGTIPPDAPPPPGAAPPSSPPEKPPVFMPGSKSINFSGATLGITEGPPE